MESHHLCELVHSSQHPRPLVRSQIHGGLLKPHRGIQKKSPPGQGDLIMKLPPEAISPYLIPQSNQENFTTSASTNSGHSVHQANVGEVPTAD
jgi:hypothetical protein